MKEVARASSASRRGSPSFLTGRSSSPTFATTAFILLSLTGEFIRAFGGTGSATGQFNGPTGIAAGQGNTIFVVDRGNDRVQAFSPARIGSGTLSAAARSEQRRQHEGEAERKAKSERTSRRAGITGGNRSWR